MDKHDEQKIAYDALRKIEDNYKTELEAKVRIAEAERKKQYEEAKAANITYVCGRLTPEEGSIFRAFFTGDTIPNKGANRRIKYKIAIAGYASIWLDLPANLGKPTYWLVEHYEGGGDTSYYQFDILAKALLKAKSEYNRNYESARDE